MKIPVLSQVYSQVELFVLAYKKEISLTALQVTAAALTLWGLDGLVCTTMVSPRLFVAGLGLLSVASLIQYRSIKKLQEKNNTQKVRLGIRVKELRNTRRRLREYIEMKKNADIILKESEERFFCMAEATTEGILMHRQGVVVDGNQVLSDLIGEELKTLMGTNIQDIFFSNEDVPLPKIALAGGVGVEEALVKKKNGKIFPVEITSRAFPFFGQRVQVTSIKDMSRRDEMEKEKTQAEKCYREELEKSRDAALESVRFKSRFLANMSHEIRTPMNAIIGLNELLLDSGLDNVQEDFCRTVQQASKNLLALINDVLDLSRIEAGGLNLNLEDAKPKECLEQLAAMFRPRAKAKGLEMELHIEESLFETIRVDRVRMGQIMVNLVGNAVKFTDEGHITVRGRGGKTADKSWMEYEVEDTGLGMDPEDIERMFLPFEQMDNSSTRRHEGTGLGLAITREIIEMMGGTIKVLSRPFRKKGSSFVVRVPVEEISQENKDGNLKDKYCVKAERRTSAKEFGASEKDALKSRILVVEDNLVNQKVTLHQLKKLGYAAEAVENGADALEIIAQKKIGLILMDCQMPGMDGYETTIRIRNEEIKVQKKHLPIIAMTASAMNGDRQKCLDSGMDDYVSKPVDLEKLGLVLEKWSVNSKSDFSSVFEDAAMLEDDEEEDALVSMVSLRRAVGTGEEGDAAAIELYGLFKEETPSRLQGLATSLSKGDAVEVAARAHALQGGCLAVGAKRMGATAKAIGVCARSHRLEGAADLLDRLWKDYEKTLDYFLDGQRDYPAA